MHPSVPQTEVCRAWPAPDSFVPGWICQKVSNPVLGMFEQCHCSIETLEEPPPCKRKEHQALDAVALQAYCGPFCKQAGTEHSLRFWDSPALLLYAHPVTNTSCLSLSPKLLLLQDSV